MGNLLSIVSHGRKERQKIENRKRLENLKI